MQSILTISVSLLSLLSPVLGAPAPEADQGHALEARTPGNVSPLLDLSSSIEVDSYIMAVMKLTKSESYLGLRLHRFQLEKYMQNPVRGGEWKLLPTSLPVWRR